MSTMKITNDGLAQLHLSGKQTVTGDSIRLTHAGAGMFSAAIWADGFPVAVLDPVYIGTADVLILGGVRIEIDVSVF